LQKDEWIARSVDDKQDSDRRSWPGHEKAEQAMQVEAKHVTRWFTKAAYLRVESEAKRVERSERFFWTRVLAILLVAGAVATAGIGQVRRSSAGIRTAYELVKANDELRAQIESNRHQEAKLTGLKNPNDLRREAQDHWQMHVPGADEQIEVD